MCGLARGGTRGAQAVRAWRTNVRGTCGTWAGNSNHDNHDDFSNGGPSGGEPPGVGAMGNDAVSGQTGRADAAVPTRVCVERGTIMERVWVMVKYVEVGSGNAAGLTRMWLDQLPEWLSNRNTGTGTVTMITEIRRPA